MFSIPLPVHSMHEVAVQQNLIFPKAYCRASKVSETLSGCTNLKYAVRIYIVDVRDI